MKEVILVIRWKYFDCWCRKCVDHLFAYYVSFEKSGSWSIYLLEIISFNKRAFLFFIYISYLDTRKKMWTPINNIEVSYKVLWVHLIILCNQWTYIIQNHFYLFPKNVSRTTINEILLTRLGNVRFINDNEIKIIS